MGLISLGCAKNLVDAEIMLGSLIKDGVEITNDAAKADVNTMTAAKDQQLQETAKGSDMKLSETQQALDKSNQDNQELQKQVANLTSELRKVQDKLSEIRPDVNRPVTSQGDGRIVRLPGAGVAYIDLGRGDQIIAGMGA